MAKLVNLIPGREIVKEELDDMDVSLPSSVERFLDRAIRALKGYNLNKRKEQYVIAKLIDALGMTPSELMQSVQKLKKNKIVNREHTIKLKDILKETEEFQQLPTELKRHFLEIISTYNQHREGMSRKSDIMQIAETLGGIADAAQEYTLREGGDWFDRVTIKRNMSELKKLQTGFEKEAVEAKSQQERLEALYEDMGHVLGRYFEIADLSEDVMKQRLGIGENKKK